MSVQAGFGYAQARIQAHVSRLPSDADWDRLAGVRRFAAFLEESRSGPLRDWVKGLSAQSHVHVLESNLRLLARESVRETAGWVPRGWRPAVEWLEWLPWLAMIEHLLRDGEVPEWMSRDAFARHLLDDAGGFDSHALVAAGFLTEDGNPGDAGIGVHWFDRWRALSPESGASQGLDPLIELIRDHRRYFASAPPGTAWELRRSLRSALRMHLHLNPLRPAAVFSYLGMVLLDLERLRAELLERALFATEPA
ncbi:hypothetical protein [Imhoffiella purpurea]|uniref:Uncharacterized protein n=1 Tax=Imhoffiella purpurea TaxID=1249627 RepID=W9V3N6_9GAMM|nr:hypothetical protein [Imhoffiella purpurea]EXJ14128.1 hypothetical protein D779_2942 [Imhoffiella purpurea]